MKFLHTSDWHVGKTLQGRSRLDEQEAVLTEIVGFAEQHQVDAVLIAGDLYDAAAPSADAQRILIKTLLALSGTGAQVIAMAGNSMTHPACSTRTGRSPGTPASRCSVSPRAADRGGVVTFTARSTGETVNVAVLPFLSQRWAIRAADLLTQTPAEAAGSYDQQIHDPHHLRAGFTPGAVDLVMAHLTVSGAVHGGGERAAQTIFEYWVPAPHSGPNRTTSPWPPAPPPDTARRLPVAYSGSPICVDFGEQDNTPVVVLVDATPTTPARTTDLPLIAGHPSPVRGTVADLATRAGELGDAFLRVYVTQPARAGLREDVLEALPNALPRSVSIRSSPRPPAPAGARATDRPVAERTIRRLLRAIRRR